MAASDMTNPSPGGTGISRRTVVKGMAWSVPAIAVSSAVPAYALTGEPPTIQYLAACKQPGASCRPEGFLKGYTFLIQINNPNPEPIYVYTSGTGTLPVYFAEQSDEDFTYGTAKIFIPGPPPAVGAAVPTSVMIPANGVEYIIIDAGPGTDSSQTSAEITACFAWGHTPNPGDDPDHDYSFTAPLDPADLPVSGDGWVCGQVSIAAFPPCKDCLPTS